MIKSGAEGGVVNKYKKILEDAGANVEVQDSQSQKTVGVSNAKDSNQANHIESVEIVNCGRCNANNAITNQICKACGHALSDKDKNPEQQVDISTGSPKIPEAWNSNHRDLFKNKKNIYVLAGFAGLAALAALAFLVTAPSTMTRKVAESITPAVNRAQYSITSNPHGIILRREGAETIYLGKDCDVISPELGKGRWSASANGVNVILSKSEINISDLKPEIPNCRDSKNQETDSTIKKINPKDNTAVVTILTDLPLTDFKKIVREKMKYKRYLASHNCFIQKQACVNIEDAVLSRENDFDYIYAAEAGMPIDEKNQIQSFHAAIGSIRFLKFQYFQGDLKLIAESDYQSCGAFGQTCTAATFKIGVGPELGWLISHGDVHQGIVGSHHFAYAVFNNRIKNIFAIQTSYSNSNYYSDEREPDGGIISFSTEISSIPTAAERFNDLGVAIKMSKTRNKKKTETNFNFISKFDKQANSYNTKPIDKFLEGGDYGY